MSDLFFALSRQGRGMADKNRRIPVNRAALPMDGKNLPRARLWDKPKTVIRKLSSPQIRNRPHKMTQRSKR